METGTMTGLFDIFGGHSAVLTNFSVNMTVLRVCGFARPFDWVSRGGDREGTCRVTDRAPKGWSPDARRLLRPPTPAPLLGASGARFAVSGPPLAVGGLLQDPGITHLVTHPVYPPGLYTHPSTHPSAQCSLHVHSARYSPFGHRVGEPRGSRTQW